MTAPVTLTLPFALLVPDNARHGLVGRTIRLTRRYRDAKHALHLTALAGWRQAGQRRPFDHDVVVDAALYLPDRRRRDVLNFAKILGDALAHVCWHDDAQIADARWYRAGFDHDEPRLVLTVTPLGGEP